MWKFLLSHSAKAVRYHTLTRSPFFNVMRSIPVHFIVNQCVCVCILCWADCNYVSKAIDRQFHGNTNSPLKCIFPFGLYLSPSFRLVHPSANLIVSGVFFPILLSLFQIPASTRAPDEVHLLPFKLFRIAINSLNMHNDEFQVPNNWRYKKERFMFLPLTPLSAVSVGLFLFHRCSHRFYKRIIKLDLNTEKHRISEVFAFPCSTFTLNSYLHFMDLLRNHKWNA